MLYRGNCNFTVKVKNAQIAGALGVIVISNVAGAPVNMNGIDTSITIPSVMVSNVNGTAIKNTINTTAVNATINTSLPE